ncbi:MAG: peptidase, partial [Thermoplasmatales archaeon]|nr:peptidase [Thermoplasmatales archaeon]
MVVQTQIENYWVFLNIDSSRLTYTGIVKIAVIGSDGKFFLNSVDLSIHSVKINGSGVNYKTVQDQQSIIPEGIKPGDFYAEIEFSGTIPHLLTGLYLAKSRNGNIFTTQFESTGARRM